MRPRFALMICSAALIALASVPAVAQQKTVKQCNDEWTANKASIQASGKTKKAFIAECRGQPAGTSTTPAPATTAVPKSARTAAPHATPGTKTAKECNAEWTANKAAIQASKKTKKEFMTECRAQPAGTTTATPSPAAPPRPAPAPSTATAPSTPPPAAPRAPARQPSTAAAPTGAGQFSMEGQAKARCLETRWFG
jgi:hypothetical protein